MPGRSRRTHRSLRRIVHDDGGGQARRRDSDDQQRHEASAVHTDALELHHARNPSRVARSRRCTTHWVVWKVTFGSLSLEG